MTRVKKWFATIFSCIKQDDYEAQFSGELVCSYPTLIIPERVPIPSLHTPASNFIQVEEKEKKEKEDSVERTNDIPSSNNPPVDIDNNDNQKHSEILRNVEEEEYEALSFRQFIFKKESREHEEEETQILEQIPEDEGFSFWSEDSIAYNVLKLSSDISRMEEEHKEQDDGKSVSLKDLWINQESENQPRKEGDDDQIPAERILEEIQNQIKPTRLSFNGRSTSRYIVMDPSVDFSAGFSIKSSSSSSTSTSSSQNKKKLEKEAQKTVKNQMNTPKARPLALKSRLANPQLEPTTRSNLPSRQQISSHSSINSSAGLRRPSSSGGSRPSTPTGRPTLSATSKPASVSGSRPTTNAGLKPSTTSRATSATISRPSRSATPTRSSLPSTKSTVPPRSSTPTPRSTTRSSTPTTTRPTISAPKPASRSSTPTRRPSTVSSMTHTSAPVVRSPSVSSVSRSVSSTVKNPMQPRSSSPTVKPRPWKPSEMPGFSLDAPPNLRTSLSDRPNSASRGRPGAPSVRSSSIEPVSNGRVRRQSCSPSRGRPPNGMFHSSGGSVPAGNQLYAKANDNVSPGMVGSKMVERVINMRKLIPPKQDDKHSPLSNLSGKSSSPDKLWLWKKPLQEIFTSLDMAIRHMDIRKTIPGNLRPLMNNIPASSMYSVRSGSTRSRTISVSDSPLATSSNGSSELSVNNNALCSATEMEDDISSDKGVRSPASMRGR